MNPGKVYDPSKIKYIARKEMWTSSVFKNAQIYTENSAIFHDNKYVGNFVNILFPKS